MIIPLSPKSPKNPKSPKKPKNNKTLKTPKTLKALTPNLSYLETLVPYRSLIEALYTLRSPPVVSFNII